MSMYKPRCNLLACYGPVSQLVFWSDKLITGRNRCQLSTVARAYWVGSLPLS